MIRVNLADGSFFHQKASSLGGECAQESPKLIQWDRDGNSPGGIFITDMRIADVADFNDYYYCIGWLLEPPSLSDNHYKQAILHQDKFDAILTFDTGLVDAYPGKFIYYPFGGSWIQEKDWQTYPKSKTVSMIASQKKGAEGHRLRHAVATRFPQYATAMGVDVMGYGYKPIQSKLEGLADYHYSIIIESCRHEEYFSEKLIDCLACGTVPIYWGCQNIGKYFNRNGILTFSTIGELEAILVQVVSLPDYKMRSEAIKENMETARQYRCAEDWIAKCYPELFEGCTRVGNE